MDIAKEQVSNPTPSKLNREKEKEKNELSSNDLRNNIKQFKIGVLRGGRTMVFKIFQGMWMKCTKFENIKPLAKMLNENTAE